MTRLLHTGTRLTLWLGLGLLLTAGISVAMVNRMQRQLAVDEARDKALLLLDRNLAIHAYINRTLLPRGANIADQCILPHADWVSSTVAIREIDRLLERAGAMHPDAGYYYKESSINARSPDNEADPLERAFLERLNREPDLTEISEVRDFDGRPYYVVMHRGEAMEAGCLGCHGDPAAAPGEIVQRYGRKLSFGRTLGETVSAISIRIPLAPAYAAANRMALHLSLVLIAALLSITALQLIVWRRLLLAPLLQLRDRALRIARDPHHLGETVAPPPRAGRELVELGGAFNLMSLRLREGQELLEEQVRRRTAELEQQIDACTLIEEEMRGALELNQAMLDHAPVGILIYRADGACLRVNDAATRIVGASREALEAQNYLHLDSWRKSGLLDLARTAMQDNRSVARDIHIVTSFGREGWWEAVCTPVASTGESRLLLLINDISERVQMQETLLQHEKSRSVASLAEGVAHEINNPLAIIAQSAQNLTQRLNPEHPANRASARDCGLDPTALACYRDRRNLDLFLTAIVEAAERAAAIVSVLSHFAELHEGAKRPLRLAEILDETLKLVGYERLQDSQVFTLRREYDPAVPALPLVEQELVQVVSSLLTNALQALTANPPERPPQLIVRLRRADDTAVIEVEDNGPGMPDEVRRRVFEPFFTTKDPSKTGRGLSLWASYMLVTRNYHGRIEVVSTPQVGTRFSVILPFPSPSEAADEPR